MSVEPLLPVYLVTGSDRPKIARALGRLRSRFEADSVDQLAADSASGADAVAACNALGLFGGETGGRLVIVHGAERWRKADLEAVAAYLKDPVEGAVLALVTEEAPRGTALTGLAEKQGKVLRYDVPKASKLQEWVRAELRRLNVQADAEAARAFVELVGDDTIALAGEMEKVAAWAGGDSIGRSEVELLVAPAV